MPIDRSCRPNEAASPRARCRTAPLDRRAPNRRRSIDLRSAPTFDQGAQESGEALDPSRPRPRREPSREPTEFRPGPASSGGAPSYEPYQFSLSLVHPSRARPHRRARKAPRLRAACPIRDSGPTVYGGQSRPAPERALREPRPPNAPRAAAKDVPSASAPRHRHAQRRRPRAVAAPSHAGGAEAPALKTEDCRLKIHGLTIAYCRLGAQAPQPMNQSSIANRQSV